RENNRTQTTASYVIGTFVYIFSGFTMQANIHIIFVHAMVYTPLLLLGGERILAGKRQGVLAAGTFLFALSGFYYLYIGSIALGVYVLYRLVYIRAGFQKSFLKVVRVAAEYMTGLSLAAFLFVPAVLGFLSSNRAHIQTQFKLFDSWKKIRKFLVNMFFPHSNYQVFSVAVIGVVVMMLVLFSKRRRTERRNVITLLVLAWIPAVSCVMSGFGEIYDRWELLIVLYAAFLVVTCWDTLDELNLLQKLFPAVVYGILGLWGKKRDWFDTEAFRIMMACYGVILLFLIVLYPLTKKAKGEEKRRLCSLVFFGVMIVMICKSWQCNSIDREISYVQERNVQAELIQDKSIYRVSNERTFTEPRNGQNIALIQNYNGLSEYFSIENPSFTNALLEWDVNPDSSMNHMNVGLDQRTILETLSAVKYMLKRTASKVLVPYGYQKIRETKDGEWSLYQNTNALPIFYTYDSVLADGTYDGRNGFEKQQIMLRTAAVKDYKGPLPRADASLGRMHPLGYQIAKIEKGELVDGELCLKAGAVLTLKAVLATQGENYVSFDDVALKGSFSVELPGENRLKEANISEDFYNGNAGVNMGAVSSGAEQEIVISFHKKEKFPLDHLKLYAYDFADFRACLKERRRTPVTGIAMTNNKLGCEVSAVKPQILCMAVPYSKGWSAYVDGKRVKIYQINDMFMGIELPKGVHHIEFCYFTYGLKAGLFITLTTVLIILFVFVKNKCWHQRKISLQSI
ncbi:MAG: YfhO family protein, partial [Lachnospiraceae bacterium]|nr:YfhO family protein [Lachnospiraceae bacterium]